MGAVSAELDKAELKLHDDNAIWTRAELLRWFNDGYRQFLAMAKSASRFWNIDVPGGFTFAHTYDWESAYTGGTHNRFTFPVQSGRMAATFVWEAEMVEGITPTNSRDVCSQPWERGC